MKQMLQKILPPISKNSFLNREKKRNLNEAGIIRSNGKEGLCGHSLNLALTRTLIGALLCILFAACATSPEAKEKAERDARIDSETAIHFYDIDTFRKSIFPINLYGAITPCIFIDKTVESILKDQKCRTDFIDYFLVSKCSFSEKHFSDFIGGSCNDNINKIARSFQPDSLKKSYFDALELDSGVSYKTNYENLKRSLLDSCGNKVGDDCARSAALKEAEKEHDVEVSKRNQLALEEEQKKKAEEELRVKKEFEATIIYKSGKQIWVKGSSINRDELTPNACAKKDLSALIFFRKKSNKIPTTQEMEANAEFYCVESAGGSYEENVEVSEQDKKAIEEIRGTVQLLPPNESRAKYRQKYESIIQRVRGYSRHVQCAEGLVAKDAAVTVPNFTDFVSNDSINESFAKVSWRCESERAFPIRQLCLKQERLFIETDKDKVIQSMIFPVQNVYEIRKNEIAIPIIPSCYEIKKCENTEIRSGKICVSCPKGFVLDTVMTKKYKDENRAGSEESMNDEILCKGTESEFR